MQEYSLGTMAIITGDSRDWNHGLNIDSLVQLNRYDAFDRTYYVESMDEGVTSWVPEEDLVPPPSEEEVAGAIASILKKDDE